MVRSSLASHGLKSEGCRSCPRPLTLLRVPSILASRSAVRHYEWMADAGSEVPFHGDRKVVAEMGSTFRGHMSLTEARNGPAATVVLAGCPLVVQ
jgi:hypothetical protein